MSKSWRDKRQLGLSIDKNWSHQRSGMGCREQTDKGSQKVPTSSYERNKSCGCNVQHVDYS